MNRYALRVIAIAALASGPILAGCRPALAQARASAPAGAASPRQPFVLAQAQPAPAAPVAPAPAPEQPIGLPRVRDYEPIPELRDIYFDFGKAVIRPGDVKILDANAAWLRANPDHLVLIEGHCDNRGATNRKNEFNMDLGERRAQAAMNHLVAQGVAPEPHYHPELWGRAAAVYRGERTVLEPEPAIALSREAALAEEHGHARRRQSAFRTVQCRPAGTVIHRALTSVMCAASSCRCNVLVATRSTADRQTSAAIAGSVCATCDERTPLHPSFHSAHRRTARLRPSRSQPRPPRTDRAGETGSERRHGWLGVCRPASVDGGQWRGAGREAARCDPSERSSDVRDVAWVWLGTVSVSVVIGVLGAALVRTHLATPSAEPPLVHRH